MSEGSYRPTPGDNQLRTGMAEQEQATRDPKSPPHEQCISRDTADSQSSSSAANGGIPLYHYNDLPLFMRGNPYITSGYRAYLSYGMCLKSVFVLSNETLNIWTHLLGLMFFGCLMLDDVFSFLPEHNATPLDYLVFVVMDTSFQACMSCSAGYHIFYCQSEMASRRWLGLDLVGVSIGFCGILFPGAYYAFSCDRRLQAFYVLLLAVCLIISGVFLAQPGFLTPAWQLRRVLMYGISIFLGLAPVLHWIALQGGFYSSVVLLFLPQILTIFLLIVTGGAFYVSKFPEIRFPGHFDYIASSHQWWHVLIVLSFTATHHFAAYVFTYLNTNGCAGSVFSEPIHTGR